MGKPFLVVYYTYEKIFKRYCTWYICGLQENEVTHNQYSFQEIYDVIQEFVSYVFVGLILSVGAVFGYPYYKTFISLGAVLLLVWAFILYYFLNSKDFKKIKKK